ncbi:MAG: hypothetical protein NTZ17_03145 [Phycisphaerae bacterium]|nr:hypothetical protein [Phycisphaerae bacterium]
MNESKWTCERCGKQYDLEMGEGWVLLAEEIPSPEHGKLSSVEPYEAVCCECADELVAIMEKCNQDCADCEATQTWGLSIRECLRFQFKFDLLKAPPLEGKVSVFGCLYDAKEVLRVFQTS